MRADVDLNDWESVRGWYQEICSRWERLDEQRHAEGNSLEIQSQMREAEAELREAQPHFSRLFKEWQASLQPNDTHKQLQF